MKLNITNTIKVNKLPQISAKANISSKTTTKIVSILRLVYGCKPGHLAPIYILYACAIAYKHIISTT